MGRTEYFWSLVLFPFSEALMVLNGVLNCVPFTYQTNIFWVQIHFNAELPFSFLLCRLPEWRGPGQTGRGNASQGTPRRRGGALHLCPHQETRGQPPSQEDLRGVARRSRQREGLQDASHPVPRSREEHKCAEYKMVAAN